MDPQNNNSFGSFGTGMPDGGSNGFGNEMSSDTNVSSQPIVSGPIVSGGATAVDNDNFVSSEFPKGGLSIGGGEKKSRKGLIIGLVVVLVLVLLVGGGFGVYAWKNGLFGHTGSGSSDDQSSIGDVRVVFNSYINYAVTGKINSEDITNEAIIDLNYPYSLQIGANERDSYLKKMDSMATILAKELDAKYEMDLYDMNLYFIHLVEVYPMDLPDVEKIYLVNGYDKTEQFINEHFESEIVDPVFETYIEVAKDLAIYELGIVANADKAGCVENGMVRDNCYNMTEEEKKNYDKKTNAQYAQEKILANNANEAVIVLYDSIYSAGSNDE